MPLSWLSRFIDFLWKYEILAGQSKENFLTQIREKLKLHSSRYGEVISSVRNIKFSEGWLSLTVKFKYIVHRIGKGCDIFDFTLVINYFKRGRGVESNMMLDDAEWSGDDWWREAQDERAEEGVEIEKRARVGRGGQFINEGFHTKLLFSYFFNRWNQLPITNLLALNVLTKFSADTFLQKNIQTFSVVRLNIEPIEFLCDSKYITKQHFVQNSIKRCMFLSTWSCAFTSTGHRVVPLISTMAHLDRNGNFLLLRIA